MAGSLLSHDTPIVVIGDDNEEEAVMRLGRIGFDNVAGYLRGGMQTLDGHPELLQTVPRITAAALAEQTQQASAPFVLDVRSEKEFNIVHLDNSHNIPLTHLRERLAEVPQDRPVVVHCEGGYRSAIACSILTQSGRANVTDLVGGIKAWIATRLPTTPEKHHDLRNKDLRTAPKVARSSPTACGAWAFPPAIKNTRTDAGG